MTIWIYPLAFVAGIAAGAALAWRRIRRDRRAIEKCYDESRQM